MATIKKSFDDPSRSNGKGSLYLESSQSIVLTGQRWPIIWSGHLNGTKVRVIQKSGASSNPNNYELENFPFQYQWLRGEMASLIDNKFKKID